MGNKRIIFAIFVLALFFGTVGTSEAHEMEGDDTMAWIGKNNYLTSAEMQNNATIVYNYMLAQGWSVNAICAMIGNMEVESNINPNIWEGLVVNVSKGYGLVQWTPSTKLSDWCTANGLDYTNGYVQLQRIIYESENGLQWFRNPLASPSEPPITFKQFTTSNLDLTTLANYWCWYYEHPAEEYMYGREQYAMYWYNYLTGEEPPVPPTPPTPPSPSEIKKMPVWMMCKRRMLNMI